MPIQPVCEHSEHSEIQNQTNDGLDIKKEQCGKQNDQEQKSVLSKDQTLIKLLVNEEEVEIAKRKQSEEENNEQVATQAQTIN